MSLSRTIGLVSSVMLGVCAGCAAPLAPTQGPPESARTQTSGLAVQARVMAMADEYVSALGESIYTLLPRQELSPRARAMAQSFLRNGVGAALDIGAGPNPPVGMLDLLVLASLQAWSFEHHWMPNGIGDAGRPVLERLRRAEAKMWETASHTLSPDQLRTLRSLVDAWIAQNPDRVVVAMVRFEEFSDTRNINSISLRTQATGLLREVSEASGVIEDARLLGERLLWYAGRYPYLLGEQTELTTYRVLAEPEGQQLMAAADSVRRLSDQLNERLATVERTLDSQRRVLLEEVAAERSNAIHQAEAALQETVDKSINDAADGLKVAREETVDQFFERVSKERTEFLDDIESREAEIRGLMKDLRDTIGTSGTLAHELTGTVDAIDRVVARFESEPGSTREPIRVQDVRDAAAETGRAAAEATRTLEAFNRVMASEEQFARRMSELVEPVNAVVDRAFWRCAALVAMCFVGLALLRLVPRTPVPPAAGP